MTILLSSCQDQVCFCEDGWTAEDKKDKPIGARMCCDDVTNVTCSVVVVCLLCQFRCAALDACNTHAHSCLEEKLENRFTTAAVEPGELARGATVDLGRGSHFYKWKWESILLNVGAAAGGGCIIENDVAYMCV